MKTSLLSISLFIASILATGFLGIASAQDQSEAEIKLLEVTYNGEKYEMPYYALNLEIQEVTIIQSAMSLSLDATDDGSLELAIPYELIKAFWPDLSNERYFGLNIDVDGEFVEYHQVFIGSRVTFSMPIPVGAERVTLSGTLIPSDIPSITVDALNQWNNPQSDIEIHGRLWNVIEPENVPIRIGALDAFSDEIWAGNVVTNRTGDFQAMFRLPVNATGGSYEIIAEMNDHPEYQDTKGYGFFYVNAVGPYKVTTEDINKVFYISSNSSSYEPFLFKEKKVLGLIITGDVESIGVTRLVVPHDVLGGNLVAIDVNSDYELESNATHSVINLNYAHTSQPITTGVMGSTVIPEFNSVSLLILVSAFIGILMIVYTKARLLRLNAK